jgi:hypothetical protein
MGLLEALLPEKYFRAAASLCGHLETGISRCHRDGAITAVAVLTAA